MEIELKVEGMHCEGCENRIKNSLSTIEGVKEVSANHKTGIVKVTINNDELQDTVKERITDIGFNII